MRSHRHEIRREILQAAVAGDGGDDATCRGGVREAEGPAPLRVEDWAIAYDGAELVARGVAARRVLRRAGPPPSAPVSRNLA